MSDAPFQSDLSTATDRELIDELQRRSVAGVIAIECEMTIDPPLEIDVIYRSWGGWSREIGLATRLCDLRRQNAVDSFKSQNE